MDPEKCTFKMDQKSRNQWVSAHARQIGQLEDVSSPPQHAYEDEMETEAEGTATGADSTHTGNGV